jgi:hypothetical protein
LKKEKTLRIIDCYELLNRYKAPLIVIKHSESVAKASYLIGKRLKASGQTIDLRLLINAALMHDIFKIIEINDYHKYQSKKEVSQKEESWNKLKAKFKGVGHEDAFVLEFGKKYPTLSCVVLKHRYSQINEGFDLKEEEIMYYADKIVKFDKITTLKERLNDAKKRYSYKHKTKEMKKAVTDMDKKIFSLEKQIFKTTGLSQKDLINLNSISLKKLIGKEFKGEI